MIVWAHGNFIAVHFIGAAMIEYVGYYVDIIAAHGLTDNALCFARSKTGANGVNQISISLINNLQRLWCFYAHSLFALSI